MKYFDSHAHYWDAAFQSENKQESADFLIDTLLTSSVSGIVNVGTSPETSRFAKEQASKHRGMYYAAGIHPTDGTQLVVPTPGFTPVKAEDALQEIEAFFRLPDGERPVALGEIGLDYHYDDTDKDIQAFFFEEQLRLAEKWNVPVIIHDRDAHADIFDAVCKHPAIHGVIHSFSGSPEMAAEYAKRGWYISFSGTVSFKNARKVVEAAAIVPAELLLIETDCPYLTPHPFRGQRNDSGFLAYTNEALAAARGVSPEETAIQTEENARRLFGV